MIPIVSYLFSGSGTASTGLQSKIVPVSCASDYTSECTEAMSFFFFSESFSEFVSYTSHVIFYLCLSYLPHLSLCPSEDKNIIKSIFLQMHMLDWEF